MEGTPKEIKISEVSQELMKFDEIVDVHDLHVWTLTSNLFSMTVHVKVKQEYLEKTNEILSKINHVVKEKFGITHCTVQVEGDDSLINLDKK
jgi:cobalt-zinc-cadmium efflux system protein